MTGRIHGLFAASGALVLLATVAEAVEPPAAPRFFNNRVREIDARIDAIRAELKTLPEAPSGPKGGSLGYHSFQQLGAHSDIEATVDLGRAFPIDAVVMVPANVVYGIGEGGGYGFPRGFRVESAREETFASPDSIADFTSRAFPNPGGSPAVLDGRGTKGRFVRVTATELWQWQGNERRLFALGELMVFSGGRNVAPGKQVTVTNSMNSEPLWSPDCLVDGQSSLGHATARGRSRTNGFHSRIEQAPDQAKWVMIDLGAAVPLREVRIVPARPPDFPEIQGFGFPDRFVVEASLDPEFLDPVVLMDRRDLPFPNPRDNAVTLPLDALDARYVRMTATRLWRRDNDYVFALSEIEAYSGTTNVALNATVTSSDSFKRGLWSEAFLVDGFDSQDRLEPDELAWLTGLARRRELETEHLALAGERIAETDRGATRLIAATIAGGIALLALVGALLVRLRLLRTRETDRLRERIASDLHDEIGSNLGSIALLSEMAPDSPSGELREIRRIARETGDSMRDIVWVIHTGHDRLEDFIAHLREVAAGMLRNIPHTFEVESDSIPSVRPGLDFKRNVLLFYKESLHNILRHASPTAVAIRIAVSSECLSLSIADDGCGFIPGVATARDGHGLDHLRVRAAAVGGTLRVTSKPGGGTTIDLDAARIAHPRPFHRLTFLRSGHDESAP